MTFACVSPSVSCNVPYQGSPYTITGLTNQTDYTFTMIATNNDGNDSPAATFRTVQPGNVPPAPGFQCMTFTSTTTGLVYLSNATNANAGVNRGYVIYVADPTTNAIVKRVTTAPYNTSKYLTGLPTNSWFKFFVRQVNDSGQSGQSTNPNTWQYFNFPGQFGASSNALKIWIDAAQVAPSVYGATAPSFPNFAYQSPYTFSGGTANVTNSFLNSLPALQITTNQGAVVSPNFTQSPSVSFFFVNQQGFTGQYLSPLTNRYNSNICLGYQLNTYKCVLNLDGGTLYDSAKIPSDGATDIWSLTRDGNDTSVIFRYNGSTIYNVPTTTSSITDFVIGVDYFTPNPSQLDYLAEMCYYTYKMNTTEVEQMEGYLAWKWGLTANLPPTHPYKNSAP